MLCRLLVIQEESSESRAEVKSFDHGKLKHVETAEKNPLPTQADIKEELRPETLPDVSAVKDFDQHKLKHVETQEKTVMPTADGTFAFIEQTRYVYLCVMVNMPLEASSIIVTYILVSKQARNASESMLEYRLGEQAIMLSNCLSVQRRKAIEEEVMCRQIILRC